MDFTRLYPLSRLSLIIALLAGTYACSEYEGSNRFQESNLLTGPAAPKMVSIPGGSFRMGCVNGQGCRNDQKPVHTVELPGFNISATEVTFSQWDACVEANGCSHKPEDEGWGRGNRPAINVSFNDITQQFIPWLNKQTGKTYRLPSEAEWEYASRAGSDASYSWGSTINCSQARYGFDIDKCGNQLLTDPVKSFSPNRWGVYDMHGNVFEWTQDCYNKSYQDAPSNGSALTQVDCRDRVYRGGSWSSTTVELRSGYRMRDYSSRRHYEIGFRLALDS